MPTSLKVFLTSLAIFDDIGAIVIIAIFYTSNISLTALIVAGLCLPVLYYFNRRGFQDKSLYLAVGTVMWVALLKSGVHATLAGVIVAMFFPLKRTDGVGSSTLESMEHDLHAAVAFIILPIFAFCNAGITVLGMNPADALGGVPMGIALGLFIGKQLGVMGFCWLGVRAGIAELPKGVSWPAFYGAAVLCGIGFTMSLFISSLAFEESGLTVMFNDRLGIIAGSVASGVLGYLILHRALRAGDPKAGATP